MVDPITASGALISLGGAGAKAGFLEGIKQLVARSSNFKMVEAVKQLELETELVREVGKRSRQQLLEDLVALAPHADKIQARLQSADDDSLPDVGDTLNVVNEVMKQIDASADRKKRKLLAAALVNSFDPGLYQAGVTTDLLPRLGELTFPDVVFLKTLQHGPTTCNSGSFTGGLGWSSARKLVKLDLIREQRAREELGPNSSIEITELGRKMLLFLSEE